MQVFADIYALSLHMFPVDIYALSLCMSYLKTWTLKNLEKLKK